jgi:hypothetical protein
MAGDFDFWFSHVTFPCTAVASLLEFWMMQRLRAHGRKQRKWDVTHYWRVARELGWSTVPYILSKGMLVFGFGALLLSK